MKPINFNKLYYTGKEIEFITQCLTSRKISGDGMFSKKCHAFFEKKYSFKKTLLTTSCTDALEMAAILLDIKEGDEIIAPSFTFVSTVNAFVLRGAKIVFTDSYYNNPNIDVNKIEELITPRTKIILPVHYAGIACDMDKIIELAKKYNLHIIEDAAQAIDSYHIGTETGKQPLGSLGTLSTFSFHETKNIISGEGGMLVINDDSFITRAEILREKGTNRSAFFRGEVNKYGWVDIGSSFLPSDIIAAFLFAQLECIDSIQQKRKKIWNTYHSHLKTLEEKGKIKLPQIPSYATNNAHMFYILCKNLEERTKLVKYLKKNNIHAVFHYLSLHKSEFYKKIHGDRELPNSDYFSDCLLRLPFYAELTEKEVSFVTESIQSFYA